MEFSQMLEKRRAVNFFDPQKELSEDQLRQMVEMAAKAPSSFNLQPWNLVVVREPAEKKRLQELAWNQPKVTEAPVTLIVLADRDGWKPDHPMVKHNFQEMIQSGKMTEDKWEWFTGACQSLYGETIEKQQAFACKNAGFFAMSLMFAATSLGLDTHPMDGFDHDGVKAAFRIPDRYWIPLLLAVGYFRADQTLMPPKWRKSFDQIAVKF